MQTPEKTSTRTNTKHKIDLTKATSWTLLGVGVAALITSIIYASSILSFIGLGLTFWGALLLYIPSECMCASCLELKFKCARSSVGIFICPATKMYYTW